jgi:hypothetical protein
MAPVLEEKSIGLDPQKTMLEGRKEGRRALDLESQE